ncbi:hypothetical protein JQV19_17930 [Sulfitobacter mediterraneus]|uniref:hypothetical protein n=1 Tax=Sulfitobacter mediterraneus TaxID=83219 RepID=UPI0019396177|nr:hypothetical protein [Sulfitobacter mediterraneus]MBM1558393.1 hypothetical protein [Sulfitobacter mediterraneus]MBM1569873.1 hypothetical protein [Sulfitobacter mediterraneus]MBM1573830.1 hypothetical protein [Sulfitobacter mediterraneus]MBM1577618.1 hypothetical protein [Sulfitobacter mediterraneus]MBM1581381.1 hypothetical protein [Sulfitobacter mediterraneus]
MKKHLCRSLLAVLVSSKSVLACYPDPEFIYDEVTSVDISIATASVAAVELETKETSSCWRVDYTDIQYLYGHGAKEFFVTTCVNEVYQIDALSEEVEGFEYLGFVPNADVLLAVVPLRDQASELRYAIPSCWGPLHVNLDKMSSGERLDFLNNFRNQIDDTR